MDHNNHKHAEQERDQSMVCTCCGHYGGGDGCGCFWHSGYHGHRLLRLVILLLLLAFVFFVGVKVGEFKSAVQGFFGRGEYGHSLYMQRGVGTMMDGYGGYPLPKPIAPPALPAVPSNSK